MSDSTVTVTDPPAEKPQGILSIFSSKKAEDAQALVDLTEKAAQLDLENTELHKRVAELQNLEQKLAEQVAGLEESLAERLAEIESLQGQVSEAEESAGKKAAAIAAQNHVPVEDLPASENTDVEDIPADEAALEAALKECATHEEKSRLVKQFRNRSNN